MTKFWGFGVWAYPDSSLIKLSNVLIRQINLRSIYSRDRSSLIGTLYRMTEVLQWNSWNLSNKATFAFTCISILNHMCHWSHSLKPSYLQNLFGIPFFPA